MPDYRTEAVKRREKELGVFEYCQVENDLLPEPKTLVVLGPLLFGTSGAVYVGQSFND